MSSIVHLNPIIRFVEKILATKQRSLQLDRKERFNALQLLQQKSEQVGDRLKTLYEELVDGAISRDEYASKKESLSLRLEEQKRQIATLVQKASCLDTPGNNKPANKGTSQWGIRVAV